MESSVLLSLDFADDTVSDIIRCLQFLLELVTDYLKILKHRTIKTHFINCTVRIRIVTTK